MKPGIKEAKPKTIVTPYVVLKDTPEEIIKIDYIEKRHQTIVISKYYQLEVIKTRPNPKMPPNITRHRFATQGAADQYVKLYTQYKPEVVL